MAEKFVVNDPPLPRIKPGDIVRLRSGGPKMMAGSPVKGRRHCAWFDGADLNTAGIPEEFLVVVDDDYEG